MKFTIKKSQDFSVRTLIYRYLREKKEKERGKKERKRLDPL